MAESANSSHLEVGRISKAHGLRGDLVVTLVSDRTERVAPGSLLWFGDRQLVVKSSRPHQTKFLVQFEGVTNRNLADELRGAVLTAPPLEDPDVIWVHELFGSRVVDVSGTVLGVVEAVEENPASDILVLADDAGLIPLTFYVSHDADEIVVDPPEGLIEATSPLAGSDEEE